MSDRWEAAPDTDDDGTWEVRRYMDSSRYALLAYGLTEKTALLIAAAPDMLALLLELWADPRVVSHSQGPTEEWLMRARTAIAKAEGRPQKTA